MKKLVLSILFVLSFAAFANAAEGPEKDGKSDEPNFNHGGPCAQLKLDDAQKTQMKEAWFKFKEEKIDLESQVEKSRLKYEKLMADPASDYKAAKAAAKEVAENIAKMISAKELFKTKVAFEILKPEQRGPSLRCEGHMMGHGHKHHGPHDEDWN